MTENEKKLRLDPWSGARTAFAVLVGLGFVQIFAGMHTFGDWLRSLFPCVLLSALFACSLLVGESLNTGRSRWRRLADLAGCLGIVWLYRANFNLGSFHVAFTDVILASLTLGNIAIGFAFASASGGAEQRQALRSAKALEPRP